MSSVRPYLPAIIRRMSVPAISEETAKVGPGNPPAEHRFKPGTSGYPSGRPRGIARTVREQAGGDPGTLVALLLDIARDEKAITRDRISALRELLDRGWGKPPAYAAIEGRDPLEEDEISAAIRDIADELAARRNGKGAPVEAPSQASEQ